MSSICTNGFAIQSPRIPANEQGFRARCLGRIIEQKGQGTKEPRSNQVNGFQLGIRGRIRWGTHLFGSARSCRIRRLVRRG
jgi:hypothetical protein